jgi:hypothetical protein
LLRENHTDDLRNRVVDRQDATRISGRS